MSVVTRFAPSPTGYLHIGGARTALFNYLLARKLGGRFILRIEDTDRARSTDESLKKIIEDLKWLGLEWDEGPETGGPAEPYFQSQRLDIYRKYIDQLIDAGKAYKCFETAEELADARQRVQQEGKGYRYDGAARNLSAEQISQYEAEGRPCVVRLRMGFKDIPVNDSILGSVTIKSDQLEDFVILKSDGYPTYHLAVVVDDALMNVTHVLRGQEHLMNTPKHIALQESLGFSTPIYAHMPLIFNMNGGKMSKRDKEKAIKAGLPVPEIDVHDFRAAGYLPEALLNFVALLGWSPGEDRELMTLDQMVELFSIERIGKTNAKFDREKLQAFNAEYIRNATPKRLRDAIRQFSRLSENALWNLADDQLDKIFEMYGPRSRTLAEMAGQCAFFFTDEYQYDPKAIKKVLNKPHTPQVLNDVLDLLSSIESWTPQAIDKCLETYCQENELGLGKVAQPIRVAVSGGTVSPPIDATLEFLGKEKTLTRIRKTIDFVAQLNQASL